jgi:lysophospholipase L1-like esterase
MPVLFLVSIDRLATIPYAPFTEYHGMFMAHSTRDWTSRPGWSGPYQGVPARINCKGFRGSEVAPQPEPDEQRILFLGDSVAFGYRVREEDTLVNRVKELLSAEMTSKRVTTLNASIIGYSPWQEYDLLVNEGLSVHPHLIVQVFCLNDVLDKLRLKRFGGLTQGYTPIKPSTLEWSGLFRMARAFHDRRRMAIDRGVWFHRPEYAVTQLFTEPATEIVRRGWNITLESMRKIAAAAREASLPLLVVCVPSAEQLTPDPSYQPIPQRKLAALADREGFLFLDLLPVFQAYLDRSGARPSTLLFDTLHLTPAGHDLAATAVSQFVRQNDLIH